MLYKEISKKIINSKKIAIAFHVSPDGDAVGSALALLNGLLLLKKDAYIISEEEVSNNLKFLPQAETIDGLTKKPKKDTDLLVIVDCGSVDRICADLTEYKGDIINIDHHISNEEFGTLNLIEPKASATCEMIYFLLKEMNLDFGCKNEQVLDIGRCIYTGLITDTGSFRHSNVTKRTLSVAGDLIDMGLKHSKIYNELFDNKPFNKVKLIGYALSEIELFLENKVSLIGLSLNLLEELNLGSVDTSDIISTALGIENIEVAVVLKETEDGVKASLRSKDDVDVRKIAESLGGGGHIKAAGLKIKNVSLEEAKKQILEEISKEL